MRVFLGASFGVWFGPVPIRIDITADLTYSRFRQSPLGMMTSGFVVNALGESLIGVTLLSLHKYSLLDV
jgi:hypothetical protein